MNKFIGKWFIEDMEMWDRNFIDLVERGNFTFKLNDSGSFAFGAVSGNMDCKIANEQLDFTFEGEDECDSTSGRGYVKLTKEGKLSGQIYFHQGDNSGFTAIRNE